MMMSAMALVSDYSLSCYSVKRLRLQCDLVVSVNRVYDAADMYNCSQPPVAAVCFCLLEGWG